MMPIPPGMDPHRSDPSTPSTPTSLHLAPAATRQKQGGGSNGFGETQGRHEDRAHRVRSHRPFALALTGAFVGVSGLALFHHEMWRDEWQSWMLARDSTSIAQIIDSMLDEGHPPGWNLLLYFLSRFTRDAMAMQLLHLGIATASVYLLARYAPLSRVQKGLLAFSYFLAYEYAVIARPYALGVLALFVFCVLYSRAGTDRRLLLASLLLLASSSLYGVLLALSAAGMWVVDRTLSLPAAQRRVRIRAVLALSGVGLALVIAALLWLADGHAAQTSLGLSRRHLAETLSAISRAYLPFPEMTEPLFWGSHFIGSSSRSDLLQGAVLSAALGTGALLLFLRKPPVLAFYVLGTGALLAFRHFIFSGWLRHDGHLFVLFIACLWLSKVPMATLNLPFVSDRFRWRASRLGTVFVMSILAVQVGAAAVLLNADIRRPFSAAPQAAAFIRANDLDTMAIAAAPAPRGSSIAGLLDRPIHYFALGSVGTFIRWRSYVAAIDYDISMSLFNPLFEESTSDLLVILSERFDDWENVDVQELAHFPAGLEGKEEYFLYRVRKSVQPAE
jgi:hypothetical protein